MTEYNFWLTKGRVRLPSPLSLPSLFSSLNPVCPSKINHSQSSKHSWPCPSTSHIGPEPIRFPHTFTFDPYQRPSELLWLSSIRSRIAWTWTLINIHFFVFFQISDYARLSTRDTKTQSKQVMFQPSSVRGAGGGVGGRGWGGERNWDKYAAIITCYDKC